MDSSRRLFVTHGLCGCMLCFGGMSAFARVSPSSMTPLVTPGYEPVDMDERGLWQACDQLEDEVKSPTPTCSWVTWL